jgi:hypothetical protein
MSLLRELKERWESTLCQAHAAECHSIELYAKAEEMARAIAALEPAAEPALFPLDLNLEVGERAELTAADEASVALEQLETDHALPPSADDVVTDLQGDTVEEMREAFEDVFETQAAPIPQPEWNEPQPEGYAPVVTPEAKMFSHGIQSEQKPDPRDWPFSHLFTGKPKVDA